MNVTNFLVNSGSSTVSQNKELENLEGRMAQTAFPESKAIHSVDEQARRGYSSGGSSFGDGSGSVDSGQSSNRRRSDTGVLSHSLHNEITVLDNLRDVFVADGDLMTTIVRIEVSVSALRTG
jgi:hypothetical protein